MNLYECVYMLTSDRQTWTPIQIQADTPYKYTFTQRDTYMHKHTATQTDIYTNRHTFRHKYAPRQTVIRSYQRIYRQTYIGTDKQSQTDIQMYRPWHTNVQTDTEKHTYI